MLYPARRWHRILILVAGMAWTLYLDEVTQVRSSYRLVLAIQSTVEHAGPLFFNRIPYTHIHTTLYANIRLTLTIKWLETLFCRLTSWLSYLKCHCRLFNSNSDALIIPSRISSNNASSSQSTGNGICWWCCCCWFFANGDVQSFHVFCGLV